MIAERGVLVTGFEPFGEPPAPNPSGELLGPLEAAWSEPEPLATAVLPVEFGAAAERLLALVERHRPRVVIALGLAAGREAITPERVAVNLDDARIADNAGARPLDRPVVDDGPAAYFSTLPVKAITAALTEAGVPAEVSYSAGTYVCNHVFYALQHALRAHPQVRSGFVHVPTAEVLDVERQARAVAVAARTALRSGPGDLAVPGGRVD